jgi:hypothetical protein
MYFMLGTEEGEVCSIWLRKSGLRDDRPKWGDPGGLAECGEDPGFQRISRLPKVGRVIRYSTDQVAVFLFIHCHHSVPASLAPHGVAYSPVSLRLATDRWLVTPDRQDVRSYCVLWRIRHHGLCAGRSRIARDGNIPCISPGELEFKSW